MINDYKNQTKNYHNRGFKEKGISFQRKYPNEDVIRFFYRYKLKNKKIIDLGCGNGRNSIFLLNNNCNVVAVDFSIEALNILKTKIRNKKKISLLEDSMPYLKKVKGKFDFAIDCFSSYSLTEKDFKIYLKIISKKIKKNGVLHLQTLSTKSDIYKKFKPAEKFKNSILSQKRKTSPFFGDEYLFSFYSKKKLTTLLKKFFKIISFEIHSRTYRNTSEHFEYFVIDCKKV